MLVKLTIKEVTILNELSSILFVPNVARSLHVNVNVYIIKYLKNLKNSLFLSVISV